MMAASRRLRHSNLTLYASLSSDFSAAALPPFSTKSRSFTSRNDEDNSNQRTIRRTPPEPIPNRPLRAGQPVYQSEQNLPSTTTSNSRDPFRFDKFGDDKEENATKEQYPRFSQPKNQGRGLRDKFGDDEGESTMRQRNPRFSQPNQGRGLLDKFGAAKGENTRQQYPRKPSGFEGGKQGHDFLDKFKLGFGNGEKQGHDFLDKFKLGFDKGEKQVPPGSASAEKEVQMGVVKEATRDDDDDEKLHHPPPDADEIFKKLKETGLIPNAVAMLDGLCKDGLVQEAMKLFGLMREKGTIPEVVIYTAVVEGFCKAQKLDDAKRIFLKMKGNGISPNAFSYAVLIRGLCKGKRLEDAVEFCVEMLDAGHSPNLATFTGLVDAFCREKGLEEAQGVIRALTQKGFCFDEKQVREYLEKKGPFLPLVWEAIFGKKISERLF